MSAVDTEKLRELLASDDFVAFTADGAGPMRAVDAVELERLIREAERDELLLTRREEEWRRRTRQILSRLLAAYEADAGIDNPEREELLEAVRKEVGR